MMHIPGPWQVKPWRDIDGEQQYAIYAESGEALADVMAGEAHPNAKANADLMASSPKLKKDRDALLEACKSALEAMEYLGNVLNNMDAGLDKDEEYTAPRFVKVRTAIAKAEEEER